MATGAVARDIVFTLRREIAKIEGRLPASLSAAGGEAIVLRRNHPSGRVATGVEGLDRALGGGLPAGALIEILGSQTRNAGVAAGFALALAGTAARQAGAADSPLLWIGTAEVFREAGFPYPPAIAGQFGIGAQNLLFSEVASLADALWIAEEAAPLATLAAVVVEVRGNPGKIDLTATRRLHRRAGQAGRPVFLIRQAALAHPTAAPVRLIVDPAPAAPRFTLAGPLAGSVGLPAFKVTVGKCASAGEFIVEWNSHDLSFQPARSQDTRRVVPLSGDREDMAPAPGSVLAFAPGQDVAAARDQPPRGQYAAHRGPRRTG